ncbi:MAG: TonB-dependent receptor plug domain-containing protein [Polyangiaceae bacterium]|nr:TonB-dependent receptor plug domain-containing protein [Polyangiaceae bacterium]
MRVVPWVPFTLAAGVFGLTCAGGALAQDSPGADAAAREPAAEPSDTPGEEVPLEDDEYGATAEVEGAPPEPAERTISRERLTTTAGTRGDALLAVETLPGVGRTSGDARPVLRGAAQEDSQAYVDGIPIPQLFHFGGVTSTFSSRLLDRVTLQPSNFPARYGRVTGGVVEGRIRSPRRDGLHGVVDVSLVDSSVLAEGPLGGGTGVAFGARRSNLDAAFEAFVPEDAYRVVAAPVYWDYQGMVEHDLGEDHTLRLLAFGSRDQIELVFATPADEDPSLRGSVGGTLEYHRVQARGTGRATRTATYELGVTVGRFHVLQQIGPLYQEFAKDELFVLGEWRQSLGAQLDVNLGLDVAASYWDARYRGPQPGQFEGDPSGREPIGARRELRSSASANLEQPAAWIELAWRPSSRVTIVPALRVDHFAQLGVTTFDPRLSARARVAARTTLKSGVGLYTQPPEFWQTLPEVGNPDVGPFRALHLTTGVERELRPSLRGGVDLFARTMFDRIVATEGSRPPFYENDGWGRAYGVETYVDGEVAPGHTVLAAYTLSRSERRDRNDPLRPFDKDQPHVLSLTTSHDLGAGWSAGTRFRLVSGNPQTPVRGTVYDASLDLYRPVYGPTGSERDPTFHQLDLRLEKQFRVGSGRIAAYLEVQNAYLSENPEGYRYAYDYSRREPVSGVPILPNLGIRGEL